MCDVFNAFFYEKTYFYYCSATYGDRNIYMTSSLVTIDTFVSTVNILFKSVSLLSLSCLHPWSEGAGVVLS